MQESKDNKTNVVSFSEMKGAQVSEDRNDAMERLKQRIMIRHQAAEILSEQEEGPSVGP